MATNNTTVKLTLKVTSFILRLLVNIFFYIIVVILTINVSKLAYDFSYQLFGPVTMEPAPGTDIIIEINKGDSSMDVASKLEMKLAIKSKYAFYLKTKLQKAVIMPGTYEINSSMTYKDILAVITDLSASLTKEADASDKPAASEKKTDTNKAADTEKDTDTNKTENTNKTVDTNMTTDTDKTTDTDNTTNADGGADSPAQ